MKAEKLKSLVDALNKLGYEIHKIEPELNQRPEYLNMTTGNIVIIIGESEPKQ